MAETQITQGEGQDGIEIVESTLDLPEPLLQEIGRVITGYAQLEQNLTQTAYIVLGISRIEGRIAIREPRATDRLDLLRDLLDQKGIKVTVDLVALRKEIEEAAIKRDWLAHGIWAKRRGILYLRITKGSHPVPWPPGKSKRILRPHGLEFRAEECQELAAKIRRALDTFDRVGLEIDAAVAASQKK